MSIKNNININPLKNLVATPFRALSMVKQRGVELFQALGDIAKDEVQILKNTKNGIKDTFKAAFSRTGFFNKIAGVIDGTVNSLVGIVDGATRLVISPLQNIPTYIGETLEATRKDVYNLLDKSISSKDQSFSPNQATRIKDFDYKTSVAKKSYFDTATMELPHSSREDIRPVVGVKSQLRKEKRAKKRQDIKDGIVKRKTVRKEKRTQNKIERKEKRTQGRLVKKEKRLQNRVEKKEIRSQKKLIRKENKQQNKLARNEKRTQRKIARKERQSQKWKDVKERRAKRKADAAENGE